MVTLTAVAIAVLIYGAKNWFDALRTWKAGRPLLPPPRPIAPWGLIDLGLTISIWIMVSIVIALVARRIARVPDEFTLESLSPQQQVIMLWLLGIGTLTTVLIAAGAVAARHQATALELGWDARQIGNDFKLGLKAFTMLAPLVYAIQNVLTQFFESKHPLAEVLEQQRGIDFLLAAGFTAVVVAPLAEEFLYRVLLQGWLERLFEPGQTTTEIIHGGRREELPHGTPLSFERAASPSPMQADDAMYPPTSDLQASNPISTGESEADSRKALPIIVSSLLFALSHWSHGPDPIALFVFSLGLGYLYQRTNRLLPSVFLHLLLNSFSMCALAISQPS